MNFPDKPPYVKRSRGIRSDTWGMSSESFFEQYDLVSEALRPVLTIKFYRRKFAVTRCRLTWSAFGDTFTITGSGEHRIDALRSALARLGVTGIPEDVGVDDLVQQIAHSLPDKIIYLNHAEA